MDEQACADELTLIAAQIAKAESRALKYYFDIRLYEQSHCGDFPVTDDRNTYPEENTLPSWNLLLLCKAKQEREVKNY